MCVNLCLRVGTWSLSTCHVSPPQGVTKCFIEFLPVSHIIAGVKGWLAFWRCTLPSRRAESSVHPHRNCSLRYPGFDERMQFLVNFLSSPHAGDTTIKKSQSSPPSPTPTPSPTMPDWAPIPEMQENHWDSCPSFRSSWCPQKCSAWQQPDIYTIIRTWVLPWCSGFSNDSLIIRHCLTSWAWVAWDSRMRKDKHYLLTVSENKCAHRVWVQISVLST